MGKYVDAALFVYVPETEHFTQQLQVNSLQVTIIPVPLADFLEQSEEYLDQTRHVVFSGPMDGLKRVVRLSLQSPFSIGLIPMAGQKQLVRCFNLPTAPESVIELALRRDGQRIDLVVCNEQHILFFQATIGRLPLLNRDNDQSLALLLRQAFKKFQNLRLFKYTFKTGQGKTIKTAASGCMLIKRNKRTLASRLLKQEGSFTDGQVSLIVSAPFSIIEYLKFLFQAVVSKRAHEKMSSTLGYIKAAQIRIETEMKLSVAIDGQQVTTTPLLCRTLPAALQVNTGLSLPEKQQAQPGKEVVKMANLPTGREVAKALRKKVPFFAYASESRFRELFTSLRMDSRTTPTYLVLILLSTLLATLGLYLSSASVVIGAMLLAPLMAPIVALAMALLRNDSTLARRSMVSIVLGIVVALSASALISKFFPYKPITPEMLARLNPSLLDLGVALCAGVAGAYTKSFKEIMQSLAGVAIAVALVPPLAVAGIGLGRADMYFFGQAFLLFATNLIGIILAAAFTFRVLGYSAVVAGKRGVAFVAILLCIISIPLYFSYQQIADKTIVEFNWSRERFLVNGKYLIVQKADVVHRPDKDIITMDILAREPLTRDDLALFKRKIEDNFSKKITIRSRIIYIQ